MPQRQPHIIQKRVLDVAVTEQALADRFLDSAADRWAASLDAVDEAAFDRAYGDEDVTVIERLELDLGTIDPDAAEDDIAALYAASLTEALSALEARAGGAADTSVRRYDALSAALYFLETGAAPWWQQLAEGAAEASPVQALARSGEAIAAFARSRPGALQDWLSALPEPETAIARALLQYGADTVQAISESLPADAALQLLAGVRARHEGLPQSAQRSLSQLADQAAERARYRKTGEPEVEQLATQGLVAAKQTGPQGEPHASMQAVDVTPDPGQMGGAVSPAIGQAGFPEDDVAAQSADHTARKALGDNAQNRAQADEGPKVAAERAATEPKGAQDYEQDEAAEQRPGMEAEPVEALRAAEPPEAGGPEPDPEASEQESAAAEAELIRAPDGDGGEATAEAVAPMGEAEGEAAAKASQPHTQEKPDRGETYEAQAKQAMDGIANNGEDVSPPESAEEPDPPAHRQTSGPDVPYRAQSGQQDTGRPARHRQHAEGRAVSSLSAHDGEEAGTASTIPDIVFEPKPGDPLPDLRPPLQRQDSAPPSKPPAAGPAWHMGDMAAQEYAVANAGTVLLAPYLPVFFERTGLMDADGWRSDAHQVRALFLIQYLGAGVAEAPEHALLLNRLLCGLEPGVPLPLGIELTDEEMLEARNLLTVVLERWPQMSGTSIEGLRGTFLMRGGLLAEEDERWCLRIERGPYDMLLDSLPWPYRSVRFSWMPKLLEVEW